MFSKNCFILLLVFFSACFSIGQIHFDSCFVYANYENHGLKEGGLSYEFRNLAKVGVPIKLGSDLSNDLSKVITRAKVKTYLIGKLPAGIVFLTCYFAGEANNYVFWAKENVIIDDTRKTKLVVEYRSDIEFIGGLYKLYSFDEVQDD